MRAIFPVAISDVRANWLSWLSFAVTLFVSGMSTAFSLSFIVEGEADSASLGGTMLGMALMSVFASTSTLSGLLLSERRKTYVKWKLAGMSGVAVWLVLTIQVVVIATISAALGAVATSPAVSLAAEIFKREGVVVGDPSASSLVILLAVGTCVGAAILGSFGKVWSVARMSPVKAQRRSAVPVARPGVFSTLFGLLMAGSVIAILLTEPPSPDDPSGIIGIVMLLIIAMICLAGWYIRIVLQWTRLFQLCGPMPAVAAASSRLRSAFTSVQVVPWFLVAGMVVGIGSPINLMMKEFDGVSVDGTGMLFLFLTPVFAPPLIAALGSLCVMAPRLRSDSIVLRRSGASVAQRYALLVWEAVVVSSTSGLVTLAIALFGVLSTNHVIHGDVFYPGWVSSILWGPFIGIIGVMALAMFAIKFAIVTSYRQVR